MNIPWTDCLKHREFPLAVASETRRQTARSSQRSMNFLRSRLPPANASHDQSSRSDAAPGDWLIKINVCWVRAKKNCHDNVPDRKKANVSRFGKDFDDYGLIVAKCVL
jgi:hypothetical protein